MVYTVTPADTYGVTNAVREDLLDEIAIMSPVTAPLVYRLGFSGSLGQKLYSWPLDYIRPPEVDNIGQDPTNYGTSLARLSTYPDGRDADFTVPQDKVRLANGTCIVRRTVSVSGSLRAEIQAGVSDEYDYQVYQETIGIVEQTDVNMTFGIYQAGATGQAEGNARMTHGILPWMLWSSGCSSTPSGSSTAIAGRTIPRGLATSRTNFSSTFYGHSGGVALTRTQFHDNCLQPAYKRGMLIAGSQLWCGSAVKRILSQFAFVYGGTSVGTPNFQLNERNVQARENFITERVDFFETDFGVISFNLSRQLEGTQAYGFNGATSVEASGAAGFTSAANQTGTGDASTLLDVDDLFFIIEPRFWKISALRGLSYMPLGKTGDADNAMLVLEPGLKALNPIAGILCNHVSGNTTA